MHGDLFLTAKYADYAKLLGLITRFLTTEGLGIHGMGTRVDACGA